MLDSSAEHWRDLPQYENLRTWAEFSRGISPSHILNICYTGWRFHVFARDHLHLRGLRDVTRQHIERYLSWRMSQPVRNGTHYPSSNTIRSIRDRLLVVFEYWQECGYTDHNPVIPVKGPRAHKRLVAPLEDAEVERILAAHLGMSDRIRLRNRAIVHFLAFTGVRAEELTLVQLSEVVRQGEIGTKFHIRGKGAKDRIIGIPLAARTALPPYLRLRNDRTDRLFVDAYGEPMRGTALRAMMRDYKRELNMPKLGTHDLRRWCFNKMVRDGVEINIIKQIGGWSTWAAAERYIWHGTAQRAAELHAEYDPEVVRGIHPRVIVQGAVFPAEMMLAD